MTRTTRTALSHRSLALAATVALAAWLPAAASADRGGYDRAPHKIRVVPDVQVEIWTDKGPNARYCVGEPIEIYFRTNVDAYVSVFDTDTRGDTHRLFPNRYDREHFVRGGVTYSLPAEGYRFKVEGPEGYETLRVVAAESRRELRRAVKDLIRDRGAYPARYRSDWRHHEKIAVISDGVGFASIEHRVVDRYRCVAPYRPRGRHPWWR